MLEISQRMQDEITIIGLKGRLDSITSPDLEKKLLDLIANQTYQILLDLSKLDYISSAGLRVFIIACKQLKTFHGKLLICSPNQNVKEVFDVSGFSQLFKIIPTQLEAVREFSCE